MMTHKIQQRPALFWLSWLLALVPSLAAGLAQFDGFQVEQSQAGSADSDQLILDITRQGGGLIFPASKQLYFRLYRSGRLEFEVPPKFDPEATRPNFELVKQETKLNARDVDDLIRLAEQPNLLAAASSYPALEEEIDAVMVTTVSYTYRDRKKQIVITNYRPGHPKAASYYPSSLKNLLSRVVELRPKTDDEIQYGWGNIY
jgi:hypothetical protein